jgi:hypothetical protein
VAYNLKYIALESGPDVSTLKPVIGQGRQFKVEPLIANDMCLKFSGGHLRMAW